MSCGLRPGYVENIAGQIHQLDFKTKAHTPSLSELAEPQKLLTYLLQPKILALPPDTIAVYLQSALKVFGSWSAELADQRDDDDLPKVKDVVSAVLQSISDFASNPDIEIQERVRSIQHIHSESM